MTLSTKLFAMAAVPVWSSPRAGMVPVPFGGNRDRDTCGSMARPSGPNAPGGGILSLRAATAASYAKLLRLTVRNGLFARTSEGERAAMIEVGGAPAPASDFGLIP